MTDDTNPSPALHLVELLRLLQLADSAIPVGGLAHSFGLESLVEDGYVTPQNLEQFLHGWLEETGALEAAFCAHANTENFATLNERLGARKPARESREGSAAMGRRMIDLAVRAFGIAQPETAEFQYPVCFGYVANALGIAPSLSVPAFLHQTAAAQLSAAQRLLPLGHTAAQAILFRLKPQIAAVASQSLSADLDAPSFTPLVEIASMRHPHLDTRLFVS